MIRFACPRCHTTYKLRGHNAGKRTACPTCGQPLLIPGPRAHQPVLAALVKGPPKPPPVPDEPDGQLFQRLFSPEMSPWFGYCFRTGRRYDTGMFGQMLYDVSPEGIQQLVQEHGIPEDVAEAILWRSPIGLDTDDMIAEYKARGDVPVPIGYDRETWRPVFVTDDGKAPIGSPDAEEEAEPEDVVFIEYGRWESFCDWPIIVDGAGS